MRTPRSVPSCAPRGTRPSPSRPAAPNGAATGRSPLTRHRRTGCSPRRASPRADVPLSAASASPVFTRPGLPRCPATTTGTPGRPAPGAPRAGSRSRRTRPRPRPRPRTGPGVGQPAPPTSASGRPAGSGRPSGHGRTPARTGRPRPAREGGPQPYQGIPRSARPSAPGRAAYPPGTSGARSSRGCTGRAPSPSVHR